MATTKSNGGASGTGVLTVDYEDELQEPPHDLQEHHRQMPETDGWLRHSVLEKTPKAAVVQDETETAPRVTRNTRRRAVTKTAKPLDYALLQEQIRVLAYQFFEQRGYEHGHDVEDWLRAEEVILSRERGREDAA